MLHCKSGSSRTDVIDRQRRAAHKLCAFELKLLFSQVVCWCNYTRVDAWPCVLSIASCSLGLHCVCSAQHLVVLAIVLGCAQCHRFKLIFSAYFTSCIIGSWPTRPWAGYVGPIESCWAGQLHVLVTSSHMWPRCSTALVHHLRVIQRTGGSSAGSRSIGRG
jgi:hypothetical protein